MKADWTQLERFRVRKPGNHLPETNPGDRYGMFAVRLSEILCLVIIATDGDNRENPEILPEVWEHVSVHTRTLDLRGQEIKRIPTWEEMCIAKSLFWDPGECVVQYHPPQEVYVNEQATVLHLWRPRDAVIPMPPVICV